MAQDKRHKMLRVKTKNGKQKELVLFSVVHNTTADYVIKRFI